METTTDNFSFPYYKSDKWCNILKNKIKSLSNEYQKEIKENAAYFKSKGCFKGYERKGKHIQLVSADENFQIRKTENSVKKAKEAIVYPKLTTFPNINNYVPTENNDKFERNTFSVLHTNGNEGFSKTAMSIFKMQQFNLRKMHQNMKNKTRISLRTDGFGERNNERSRNKTVIKNKSLSFVYNNPQFSLNSNKGIQTGELNNRLIDKKKKYIEYLNSKNENSYIKYYYQYSLIS